jgi:hypothetical protein
MNEEGCQLGFLITDLRLQLVSHAIFQISITRSSEHTDFGKIPIPTSINTVGFELKSYPVIPVIQLSISKTWVFARFRPIPLLSVNTVGLKI